MQFVRYALLSSLLIASPLYAQEAEEQGAPGSEVVDESAPAALTEPTTAEQASETDTSEVAEEAAEEEAAPAQTAPRERERVVITPNIPEDEGEIDLLALLQEEKPVFEYEGYYRVRANYLYNAGMNKPTGSDYVNRFLRHRFRFEPRLNVSENVSFHAQIDALDDQIWGANPGNVLSQSTADIVPNVLVKRAWGQVTLPFGRLDVGRMPSNWGMGLLANDGNGFKNIFGDAHGGSTADRIAFATKPLGEDSNWILAAIYDKMVADEPLDVTGGPSAWVLGQNLGTASPANLTEVNEYIAVLLYNTEPLKLGVYQVWRYEEEGDTGYANRYNLEGDVIDAGSRVYVTDAYFKLDLGLLYAETEHVWLYGETNAVPVLQSLGARRAQLVDVEPGVTRSGTELFAAPYDQVDIDQYGYAARIGINLFPYGAEIEWGNATGDVNGFDDRETSAFSFHSDYNVGLIMFEYANAAFAAQQLAATLDSLNTLVEEGLLTETEAERLRSVSALSLTNGRVNNAFYLNPKFRYSMFDGKLTGTLAYLWAQANAERVIDLPGQGGASFKNYGHEIDLAVNYDYTKNMTFGLQAGYLFAGDYFTTQDPTSGTLVDPDDAFVVQGRFTVLF